MVMHEELKNKEHAIDQGVSSRFLSDRVRWFLCTQQSKNKNRD